MMIKSISFIMFTFYSLSTYAHSIDLSYQNLPKGPSYDAGYQDGCDSALLYDVWELKKDYTRQKMDSIYSRAWDIGFVTCRYNVYKK